MSGTTTRRLAAALVGLGALAGSVAVAAPAQAATVGSASCVDGGGVRWAVRVTWGATYASGDVTKVSVPRAAWTTTKPGAVRTDSRVRTYDGSGKLLQDLVWTGAFDYRAGAAEKARNPVDPPSAPGRAKVVLTLGVDGDGFGSCSVTLAQPVGTTPVAPSAADRYADDVVVATNAERASRGLAVLAAQTCVDSSAQAQARRMAAEGRMFHQDLQPLLQGCGLRAVAENVAAGYPSGAAVTQGWLNSPGHRANLLNAKFTLLGVGAAQGADGRWYAAQVFGTRS
ncbi:hypothetical protein GCM10009616_00860 [Microlunatus lacustris]